MLNPTRNKNDSGDRAKGDWSVHQSQDVELPGGKVLVTHGQDANVRALVIFDPDWLETGRKTTFGKELDDWSSFKYFEGVRGHCAYNRTRGCNLIPHPDRAGRNMIQIRHLLDDRLVFDRDGSTWNFSAAKSGSVHVRIKPLRDGKGRRICLLDRWVNPTDPVVENYSTYVLRFDGDGRIHGKPALKVGYWNNLHFTWNDASKGDCILCVDGEAKPFRLPQCSPSQDGLSYVHFQSLADGEDTKGFVLKSVEALN